MAIKRFMFPLDHAANDPSTSKNQEVNFEDYSKLLAVSWVGSHQQNVDLEILTLDGKDSIVDSVPLDYYKLGNGREEMVVDRILANNSVRVKYQFTTGSPVSGSLVFTVEK